MSESVRQRHSLIKEEDTEEWEEHVPEGTETFGGGNNTIYQHFANIIYKWLEDPGSHVTRNQVLASLGVSMGSMIVGYCSAWSSPAIASLMEPGSAIYISEHEASWIGSLMPLTALIGGFLGGPLLESIGRKQTIVSTALPFIIANLMVTYAQDVTLIYLGRSITGFCIGIISLSLPVYLAEAIHPEVRGTLGLLPTSLGNGGVMLCYIFGFFLDWSRLSLLGALIPLPFLLLMRTIPETPRFLFSKGKEREAKAALKWLRTSGGGGGGSNNAAKRVNVSHELHDMERAHLANKRTKFKATELAKLCYIRPLLVSMGLMFFQQMSGINAVMFYSVSIFRLSGSSIDSNLATIILGVVNIAATLLSNALIDRLGRKKLLYISDAGMIFSLVVFGAYFYLRDVVQLGAHVVPGFIPLLALVVYVVSFSVGFGPIPWLMMGEIFPSRIRGTAASISTAFNWSCTFVVTKTFMDLQLLLGAHGVFWLFAAILLVSVAFIYWVVPETQGKSLEDIEKLYTSASSASASGMANGATSSSMRNTHRVSSIANLKPTPSQIL